METYEEMSKKYNLLMQNKEFQKTEIYKNHVFWSTKNGLLVLASPLDFNNFYVGGFPQWFEKLLGEYCGKNNSNNNNTTLGKRKAEENSQFELLV